MAYRDRNLRRVELRPTASPTTLPPSSRPLAHPRSPRHAPLLPRESSIHSRASAAAPTARSAPTPPVARSDTPATLRVETHTAPNASSAAHVFSFPCPAPTVSAPAKNKSHCPRNPPPSSPCLDP